MIEIIPFHFGFFMYRELAVWFPVRWTTGQKCGHATSVFSGIR